MKASFIVVVAWPCNSTIKPLPSANRKVIDAAFSFSSEFRSHESLFPQSTSTVSRSLKSPPSTSTSSHPRSLLRMKNLYRISLLSSLLLLRRVNSLMNKLWPRWSGWRRSIRKDRSRSRYQVETSSGCKRIWNLTNLKRGITSLDIFIRLLYSWLSDIQVSFMMRQSQTWLFNAWQVQFMKGLSIFTEGFSNALSSMSARRRKDILLVTGEDYNKFHGSYRGSKKWPISLLNFGATLALWKSNLCWK